MRSIQRLIVGALASLLAVTGGFAGTDLNEVGAILVYPMVAAFELDMATPDPTMVTNDEIQTILTITNAGGDDVVAHISFIDGQSFRGNPVTGDPEPNPYYCYECDFFVPLTPNDTETLVVRKADDNLASDELAVDIISVDTLVANSCDFGFGMVIVTLENADAETLQSNVLLGEAILVDETNSWAYSLPAIPFQGKNMGDMDRQYDFDDDEYGKLPRIVAADFIAPEEDRGDITADLALFTLNFDRQHPPITDCSVTGFDAAENPFSRSVIFGCWEWFSLEEISREFVWGNLGATYCDEADSLFERFDNDAAYCDEHGWLSLNCKVDRDADGAFDADGGVHGAIVQTAESELLDRVGLELDTNPADGAWARLLYQSVTTGSDTTLNLEGPPGNLLP